MSSVCGYDSEKRNHDSFIPWQSCNASDDPLISLNPYQNKSSLDGPSTIDGPSDSKTEEGQQEFR